MGLVVVVVYEGLGVVVMGEEEGGLFYDGF